MYFERMIRQRFFPGIGTSSTHTKVLSGRNVATWATSRMLSLVAVQPTLNLDISYWDWSLDWENITQAPIWNSDLGFGGNGDEKDGESIHGHCVTDGPFAKLEVLYVEKIPYRHCLSRGFATGRNLTRFSDALRPASLEKLLRVPDYATFNLGVEDGPHLSIPRTVHGDFSTVTAPAGIQSSASILCRLRANQTYRSCFLPPSHAARPAVVEVAAIRPPEEIDGVFWQSC